MHASTHAIALHERGTDVRHAALLLVFMLAAALFPTGSAVAQSDPYQTSAVLERPQLFAPDVISTDAIEYGPSFSPDGRVLYFTRRASWRDNPAIYVSYFEKGAWQPATVAPFSGTHSDEHPFVSAAGNRIYFASKRPVEGVAPDHNDIWYVERTSDGWGTPQHLPAPINQNDIDSHPVVTEDGTLYFHSRRSGGPGAVDMYVSRMEGGRHSEPQALPFNSPQTDGEIVVGPDGRFIIFYSDRPESVGKGDLYLVTKRGDAWSEPRNLGEIVNTAEYEWTPSLSPDGRYLFYAHLAGSDSDIYQIDLSVVLGD